jgi:hypothetical protein
MHVVCVGVRFNVYFPYTAEEQNKCLAVVNAAINALNSNPKSTSGFFVLVCVSLFSSKI